MYMPIKSTTKEELDKLNTQLGNIADVLDSFSKCKKNGINIAKEQINHYTKRAERIKREILALKSKEDLKEQIVRYDEKVLLVFGSASEKDLKI